jgi:hypothetical protein
MSSSKRRFIRAKDTADVRPWAPTDTVLARNVTMRQLDADYQAEPILTGEEGAPPEELRNPRSGAQFQVEAGFPAAAGVLPAYDALMRACGLDVTVVADTSVSYSPTAIDGDYDQCDLQLRTADAIQDVPNCRGSLSFSVESGSKPVWGFNLLGQYGAPVPEANVPPDFSNWDKAAVATPTTINMFTFDGIKLCVRSFSFSDGRTPTTGRFMNCDGTDNIRRAFTGQALVEWPDLATKDIIHNAYLERTEAVVFEINHPTAAGRVMRIAAGKVQLKFGGDQDIDGTLGAQLDLVFIPDQGDDDIAITF